MKTTTIRLAALATMLTAASFGAHAAESADLAVQGMIRPSACNVSLSGNGTVDFGTISALTLSETAPTTLPDRNFSFTVVCDAPTAIGWTTTDNREGTAHPATGRALFNNSAAWFGVGSKDGRNIGAFILEIRNNQPTADGTNVAAINSYDSGQSWNNQAYVASSRQNGRIVSWGETSTSQPGTYTSITQPLTLRLAIAPTDELPELTEAIPIDGLASITINYL